MTCNELIEELKANASEKYKANVVKMGELETLVKVEGRGRLISSNSKMGRE